MITLLLLMLLLLYRHGGTATVFSTRPALGEERFLSWRRVHDR